MSATVPFHIGQALCLRTNVHNHAPQVRQRNMRTANAICGRDAKCSATDAISSDLRERSDRVGLAQSVACPPLAR